MTFLELEKFMKDYNIPKDVKLMSNSGWECDATEIDGVYYCKEENVIHFTQDFYDIQHGGYKEKPVDNRVWIPLKPIEDKGE